ncbi:Eaa1 [Klebsiella pneumoniae]|nr:Eaa1 [Klebsiella pneumoniae]
MTKSTITRERLEEIVSDPMINQGSEFAMMARMALAAMDSESWCLPLDYLQGHKDGLEWASQLAEANHPEAGDWLYDDPIELAKAIRKGPDMPPSQPALDTEPVAYTDERNLGYIDRGRETAYLWGKQNSETGDVPLYRHAQPAPVVPDAATAIRACLPEFPESARDIVEECADIAENACSAAMLQVGNSPAQSDCCPAKNVVAPAQSPIDHGYLPECECSGCKATARICTEMAVNSLVIPNEMTSEQAYEIGYYYGDPVDVFARGANWMRQHIIDSTLAVAPQLPGSDPATVPGKWIPVSERMPELDTRVLLYFSDYSGHIEDGCIGDEGDGPYLYFFDGDSLSHEPTHWMPLPVAPQEVKGE